MPFTINVQWLDVRVKLSFLQPSPSPRVYVWVFPGVPEQSSNHQLRPILQSVCLHMLRPTLQRCQIVAFAESVDCTSSPCTLFLVLRFDPFVTLISSASDFWPALCPCHSGPIPPVCSAIPRSEFSLLDWAPPHKLFPFTDSPYLDHPSPTSNLTEKEKFWFEHYR